MAVGTDEEWFMRGQTGGRLDHSGSVGLGRTVADAGAQADTALGNLATMLGEAGSSMEDVCKITVYIGDRAYRSAVYPMIGKHFGEVRPVSTGIVTTAFAKPEILVEIDAVVVRRRDGEPHARLRPYHSSTAKYGTQTQDLACKFCMVVVAGNRIILRGQTGVGLDDVLYGKGSAKGQAEQAMRNVEALLADAGAGLSDVAKATVYVTERDYLADVNEVVLARFGQQSPAFTTVVVKGLASPELLMEVDIVAIKRGGTV
jgi:enamine deaminase RidA (YjgF/YER057c/UK114 family)